MIQRWPQFLAVGLLSVASAATGLVVGRQAQAPDDCSLNQRLPYLNQQLNCSQSYAVDKQAYIGLKHELTDYIADQQQSGIATEVSVYFRDLHNGPTLGLNEHENFSPASLLKLPLLLAYLDYQIERPGLLADELVLTAKTTDLQQFYPSMAGLTLGSKYSVEELLEAMIVHSDNDAYYVLLSYLREVSGTDVLQQTYIDLGLIDPTSRGDETLTTKGYASIFQQLYHASFLSTQELSNQALDLLAQSEFEVGLRAGLPENVLVAHKFGERSDLPSGEKQLHDCGVVYYPDNPYLLCVMTRGTDFTALEGVIQGISARVYAEFDSRRL